MKKVFFCGCLAACMVTLTSCLESSSGEISNTYVPGVVRFDSQQMKLVIDTRDFAPYAFYASSLASTSTLGDGDCVIFGYNVDLGSQENENRETTNTIYGQITQGPVLVDKYPCQGYMLDTTQLLENEQLLAYAIDVNLSPAYVNGMLFVYSDLTSLEDQLTRWLLYYDPDLKAEVETSYNRRVYSLFLRATITREGIANKPKQEAAINAFDAESLFNQIETIEKDYASSSATVYLKFNYINEVKEDGTIVWKYDLIPLY